MTRRLANLTLIVAATVTTFLFTLTHASSTKAQYIQDASTGIKTLNSNWYSQDTGLWDGAWWQSANALTTLADFAILQPGAANSLGIANIIQNTVKNAPKKFPGFINTFYDDEGWWAMGLIHSYDATGNEGYLETAADIFKDMQTGGGTPCMGGIFWSKDRKYGSLLGGSVLNTARTLAKAAINALSNQDGILVETDKCETQANACGFDAKQFKGVFIRNLSYLNQVIGDGDIRAFILRNADSVLSKDRDSNNRMGVAWAGPVIAANGASHGGALDALVAAARVA
ncbi:hypothetical protein BGZ89_005052 [Linnemannia elongata]|nr:hypothetical protein BGZ89_005052 [Linnemannia elongata]